MLTTKREEWRYEGGIAHAEASDIGVRPGEWPDFIAILDDRNEGFLLVFRSFERREGDILWAEYAARSGSLVAHVFND
jgi:hypothetical protein